MKLFLFTVFKIILKIIYVPLKKLPMQRKIVFLSRQGNQPGIDFSMIRDKIIKNYPEYKLVLLCRMIPEDFWGKVTYGFHILIQMYHLATSRVAVLDTYCIPVSVLDHKESLYVIQLWHALGSFKKFGWSIVDTPEGSPRKIAEAMNMHSGYDMAVCSGQRCVEPFAEAFRMAKHRVKPIGLPRMDYLSQPEYVNQIREEIYNQYPNLNNGRKTILYVPTFRKTDKMDYGMADAVERVIAAAVLTKFNLVIKTHSGKERVLFNNADNTKPDEIIGSDFLGMEFLSVSNYIISDYSSIIFEAAIQGKPCYLYCYDAGEYLEKRGFYIDYWGNIPAVRSEDIRAIMGAIALDVRPADWEIEKFAADFVQNRNGTVTGKLCCIIDRMARGEWYFDDDKNTSWSNANEVYKLRKLNREK